MANFNSLSGFKAVEYLNGSPFNGVTRRYYIPSTDTNVYAIGDPVATTQGADRDGVPQVIPGVAGSPLRGIISSIQVFGQINLQNDYVPASKLRDHYVNVIDDPQVIFEIQESGTPLTAAATGLNANFVAGTYNGFTSQYALDTSTVSSDVTLNLKLLSIAQKQQNAFGLYAKWWVLLMNHELI